MSASSSASTTAVRDYWRATLLAWHAAPALVGWLVLLHLILAVVPAGQSWIYKLLVDLVSQANRPSFQPRDLWAAGGLFVLTLLFGQTAAALIRPLDDQMSERLQGALGREILRVGERQASLAFYEDERVQNDFDKARRGVDYSLLEALSLVPYALQQFAIVTTLSLLLARFHPLVPALLIVTAVPRFWYEARLGQYIWNGMSARSPHWRWLNYCARVLLSAEYAKEVRLFGLGDFFLGLYRQTFERAHRELVTIRRREARGAMLSSLVSASVTGAVYVVIVLAASRRQIGLGDVALYTSATFQLGGALGLLIQSYGALRQHRLRLRALYDLLDWPPLLDGAHSAPLPSRARTEGQDAPPTLLPRAPRIEFRDVWFYYPGSDTPALREINLRIDPGEKIAIVGENGAGKTTLVSLLARLHDPTGGRIFIGDTPLGALDVRAWRRQLATVSQEFLRLDAPLRTNLALANLSGEEDDAALQAACEQVGLAEALQALPCGLDQMLGRRFAGGVELSGGEWQKVALARALLREEAGIVLLDEPTSALDAPTEHALFHEFLRLADHRTAILISHRFSTVAMADRIVFLEAGAIREEGSHVELLARGGKYAELFQLQASRYR
jgi:ATP-binding cassette subfamily B protein